MISGIHSGLSGALAHQRKVDAASHNVANADTDGFRKIRVDLKEGEGGGVSAEAGRVSAPGPTYLGPAGEPVQASNVDLAEEMTGLVVGERGFEASLKVIEAADEMLGELLDTVG